MLRPAARRLAAAPAVLLALGSIYTVQAQTAHTAPKNARHFYPANATIASKVNGVAIVGLANLNDPTHQKDLTNPTVSLVKGGSVPDLWVYGGTLNINGGSITGQVVASNKSHITMSGGSATGLFVVGASSTGLISSGRLDSVVSADNGKLNVTGSSCRKIEAMLNGMITMSGGSIEGSLIARGQSTFNLKGGNIGGDILVQDSATLNIYGAGLRRTPAGSDPFGAPQFTLAGKLSNGTSLNGKTLTLDKSGAAKVNFINAPAK